MKQRIWELDAFRGLCVIGMVLVHFVYDLTVLYKLVSWTPPAAFSFVQRWGGVFFLLISGICVTLGKRSVRRGMIVFGCGLLVSATTAGMYFLNLSGKGIIIYFGVLHCLGVCMLLWPLFKKLPIWLLAVLGLLLVAAGFLLEPVRVDFPWLIPLGVTFQGFVSSDYFPLLPNLGFFMIGSFLGKTIYREQKTLFPGIRAEAPILRCLGFCGKHSLWIYLLHQPALSAIFYLIPLLK